MPHFDNITSASGPATPATISGSPHKKPPEIAVLASTGAFLGGPGLAPDASWTDILGLNRVFMKILNAPGIIIPSQATPAGQWSQYLGFFGSNGVFPIITNIGGISSSSPGGPGNTRNAPIGNTVAGIDTFVYMLLNNDVPGFYFIVENYEITDDAGNTYIQLANPQHFDGTGKGAGVLLFYCENPLGRVANVLHMRMTTGDAAPGSVGLNMVCFQATNLTNVVSRGNFLAAGMG